MEEDEYGFCHRPERDAAKVLDKANLAAFVTQIRVRFDAAAKVAPKTDGAFKDRPEYVRRRWGEALRTLYAAQKNAAAYVALAEGTGLTAEDCHAIATLLLSRRKRQEALTWVERRLHLDKKAPHGSMAGHDLAKRKRDILAKLGRGNEALEAAWADYRKHPNKYTYEDLMKLVPKADRTSWHEKAIDAAGGADLHSASGLFVATKELEQLADLVRQATDHALVGLSHDTTKPVAKKLEKTQPDLAARLWCAQGLRIVNAKKSKYYDAALSNFGSAKRRFERVGLEAEWQRIVRQVRADHYRKSGFMPGSSAWWRAPDRAMSRPSSTRPKHTGTSASGERDEEDGPRRGQSHRAHRPVDQGRESHAADCRAATGPSVFARVVSGTSFQARSRWRSRASSGATPGIGTCPARSSRCVSTWPR